MKHLRTASLIVLASLAMMATAAQSDKHRTPKPRVQRAVAYFAPTGSLGSMVGTWTMRDGDRPLKAIRMVFRSNGTFAFVGPNWQSAGKFAVRESKLHLEWSSIDGSRVAPGTVKKDYNLADDSSSFTIDQYTYYKLQN